MRVAGRNGFLSSFVSSLGDFFIPLHSILSGGVSPTLPLLDTLMSLRLWNRDKRSKSVLSPGSSVTLQRDLAP